MDYDRLFLQNLLLQHWLETEPENETQEQTRLAAAVLTIGSNADHAWVSENSSTILRTSKPPPSIRNSLETLLRTPRGQCHLYRDGGRHSRFPRNPRGRFRRSLVFAPPGSWVTHCMCVGVGNWKASRWMLRVDLAWCSGQWFSSTMPQVSLHLPLCAVSRVKISNLGFNFFSVSPD